MRRRNVEVTNRRLELAAQSCGPGLTPEQRLEFKELRDRAGHLSDEVITRSFERVSCRQNRKRNRVFGHREIADYEAI